MPNTPRGDDAAPDARMAAALADRYRIERQLGEGGMATVYLAHDLKHDRRVALKVLRPELAAIVGADRFLAEIKTTANLQHPHVLALFDSGQVEGTVFYVMPFVDGESLRDRIEREKQLPIDDALRIAREVADALQYAHQLGVIHRDIKPENILLQGGHALVADFGIALAASKTGGTRMTETGMSLGTPKYMSPEQAMGERTLDARCDIYALGCVLYEMLTGDAPFTGSTAQAIMAKVLTEKPRPIVSQRDRVPPHVEDAVFTALEKLPADRFASAAEFVAALGSAGASTSATRARTASRTAATGASRRQMIVVAVAAFAAVGGWMLGRGGKEEPTASRLALFEPGSTPAFSGVARVVDISADGQTVVFTGVHPLGTRVFVRRLDGTQPKEVPNSSNTYNLRLSPDARSLYANQSGGMMQRIPLAGGSWAPAEGIQGTPFLQFAPDGKIWWGSPLSFSTFLRGPDGRDSTVFPRSIITQVMDGSRFGLGMGVTTGSNTGTPQWLNLRTGETRAIFETLVVELRYTTGYLVYVRADGGLVAAPFDADKGVITGPHIEVATSVMVTGAGFAQFAVSDNGTVAYVPGSNSDLVRVSRTGDVRVLLSEKRRYHNPRISPDGRRVAFDDVTPGGRDVWLYTEGSRDISRATFQRDGHDAVWTLDGRGLFYLSGTRGGKLDIYRTQLGSTTPPSAAGTIVELGFTGTPLSSGGFITTVPGPAGSGLDIVRLKEGASKPEMLVATDADESFVVPSSNGRWLAYVSDHSGRPEVYVRAVSGGDALLQVSQDGATEPIWSRDGKELFYRRPTLRGAELASATLEFGAEPRVIKRISLFDVSDFDTATPHANYDISADGSWFVFARRGGTDHIVILQNLPELVQRIARTGATP